MSKLMSIFNPKKWGLYKAYIDIRNYVDFIRTIKAEESNPSSKFNKWNLHRSYFYVIYATYDMSESEAKLPDEIKKLRLIESLAPIHRYLDEDLRFAECLTPQINQFYDNAGNPTLTYLVMYRFTFDKLSIKWVIKWMIILSGLTFMLIHYWTYISMLISYFIK